MRIARSPAAVLALVIAAAPALAAPSVERHELTLRLDPGAGRIEAEDRMTVRRDGGGALTLRLDASLALAEATVDGRPAQATRGDATAGVAAWTVDVPAAPGDRCAVVVRWAGAPSAGGARVRPDGAVLPAAAAWHPLDGGTAVHSVRVPAAADWDVVAAGARSAAAEPGAPATWTGTAAAAGVTVVAGRWETAEARAGAVRVTLRSLRADPARSEAATKRAAAAVERCAASLGAFPFDRIDLVETDVPAVRGEHEVGLVRASDLDAPGAVETAVFRAAWSALAPADGAAGAWIDGLARYCATAFDPSPAGAAATVALRRAACLAIAAPGDDASGLPADAARALMLFDALRRDVGEAAFAQTLRRALAARRGERTDWTAWQRAFESAAGRRLDGEFAQALTRDGAPILELATTRAGAESGRMLVSGVLRQRLAKGEAPWRLSVPVVVEHLEGREETVVDLTGPETGFSIAVPSMPLRVEADPDWRVVRREDAADAASGLRRTVRYLLPDLRTGASPERAKSVASQLAAARGADASAEARVRRIVADELRLAGVEPEEREIRFAVKRIDAGRTVLARVGGEAVAGTRPLVASPATPEGGVSVVGAVTDDDPDLAGRALVVDLGAGIAQPLAFVRQVASLAAARRASAVFVRVPDDAPPAIAELWDFAATDASAPDEDSALRRAATAAARTGADTELPLPVVAVPRSFRPARDEMFRLDVAFARHEVRTANLVGRIRAPSRRGGATVVLAAALDGPPAACAALVEAANVLSVQTDLLAADVMIVLFGGETWGARGARAWTASGGGSAGATVRVGDAGSGRVRVGGAEAPARLRRAVAAAMVQSALDVEDDPAPAPPRPRVGGGTADVTCVAPPDAAAAADPALVARTGRALALAALALSGGW